MLKNSVLYSKAVYPRHNGETVRRAVQFSFNSLLSLHTLDIESIVKENIN